MSLSISELLPSISALSHADKFRLVQLVLAQLAKENGVETSLIEETSESFKPRQFFGVSNQSKQAIDDYLTETREGWN